MLAADAAKLRMISDRSGGKKLFDGLLNEHPTDGMIYYKRGEPFEAIGEHALAATDFQSAMALFPKPEWKDRTKQALDRVKK